MKVIKKIGALFILSIHLCVMPAGRIGINLLDPEARKLRILHLLAQAASEKMRTRELEKRCAELTATIKKNEQTIKELRALIAGAKKQT